MPKASRALWKGAITFGLVHIPVSLHTASRDSGIDFDWLDSRSMDPVGYKRINKRTGREITREHIVRGVKQGEGSYVVLTDKEIGTAYPKSTQTVEIEAFVPMEEIPFLYFERPYYLAPTGKGGKVYALLREALRRSGRVGLARVVIQTKQHLAMLVPHGRALMLNLLRWEADIRDDKGLSLPPASLKTAGIGAGELRMAEELVDKMSSPFKPAQFKDRFRSQIKKLVERKARAGRTHTVEPAEEAPQQGAQIIDLTELLQRSLKGGKRAPAKARSRAAKTKTGARSGKGRKAA